MARKFVSPGVFTQEIDQSYLAAGVGSIGAVLIGATPAGPAFVPTSVSSWAEFQSKFGIVDPVSDFDSSGSPKYVLPYAARNYLKNSNALTVVRVLGSRDAQSGVVNGFAQNALGLVDVSGVMLTEIHYPYYLTASVTTTGTKLAISIKSGATELFGTTASFDTASSDYVDKALNDDPTQVATKYHYVYKNFKWMGAGAGAPYASGALSGTSSSSLDMDYTNSVTPWIQSQPIAGNPYNLFRLWTKDSGLGSIDRYKLAITNIKASSNTTVTRYGSFDIEILDYVTGQKVKSIPSCDLDPSSVNFISRRIGDVYDVWDSTQRKFVTYGTFPSVDATMPVRVELWAGQAQPPEAVPWGFYGYPENVCAPSGSTSIASLPVVTSNLNTQGNVDQSKLFGIDFSQNNISERFKAVLSTTGVNTTVTGTTFTLAHLSASGAATTSGQEYDYVTGSTFSVWPAVPGTASVPGFVLGFYGGFDGFDITSFDTLGSLQDSAAASNIGVTSLKQGVDAVANPDAIDINLMVVPGCIANRVTDYARQVCNDRADCLLIMDITGSSVSDAVSKLSLRSIDDNYAACYYPDLWYNDTDNNRQPRVKPSIAVIGAIAYSDRSNQGFFAPAGLNRGGLRDFNIVMTTDKLNYQDRNTLYEARINPIATFPGEGICIFGQKTLQVRPSALDRVNVRRMLIYAKKTISSAAKYLLFEPNNSETWDRFLKTTNKILENMRKDNGIERFKVVMDSTVNTPDLVDRNIMTGKIFLQPTKAAEYIDLSFIISSSGVSFEE